MKKLLPPALFLCGTEDLLSDDSAVMGLKWGMAGGESVVRFYPGVPHGFMSFEPGGMPPRGEGVGLT